MFREPGGAAHAGERHRSRPEAQVPGDDQLQARSSGMAECAQPELHGQKAERGLGIGYHLRLDARRVAICGDDP